MFLSESVIEFKSVSEEASPEENWSITKFSELNIPWYHGTELGQKGYNKLSVSDWIKIPSLFPC